MHHAEVVMDNLSTVSETSRSLHFSFKCAHADAFKATSETLQLDFSQTKTMKTPVTETGKTARTTESHRKRDPLKTRLVRVFVI